jgi:hypothetical protein
MSGHMLKTVNPEAADEIERQGNAPAAKRLPEVGEIVIYHMRIGHGRQGRTRFPALVQGHGERQTLNLTVILEAAELKNETLVDEIGPGREAHVWERPDISALAEIFRGTMTSLHTRVGELEARTADLEKENDSLRDCVLGEFDIPKVSIIAIMQDFENRLRTIREENVALREAWAAQIPPGLKVIGKSKKK